MSKKAAKKVARKPAKKTTRKTSAPKVTKRKYTRRKKAEPVQIVKPYIVEESGPGTDTPREDVPSGKASTQNEAAPEMGPFSADGFLNLNGYDRVSSTRGKVVFSVRKLVEASIGLENSASSTPSERDVATARQRLAVAEFELAMDRLEQAVRGR